MLKVDGLLGESAQIRELRDLVQQVSGFHPSACVMIEGEVGSGKSVVAHAIHDCSPRREQAFIPFHCGALPEDLIESALFGYERGTFIGLDNGKPGDLELADGGTILLDEISLMPLPVQAKLLHVLEEREVRRVGGSENVKVDVRVIAATSLNIEKDVKHEHFRQDLYNRLNVVRIPLPPLRDRRTDVMILAEHFLAQMRAEYGLPLQWLTADAQAALLRYPWPGNVRELHNVVERAALLAVESAITAEELGLP